MSIQFPLTYNVLAIPQAGEPVSLQRKTISALSPDEVLVRIDYASINSMDPRLAMRNLFQLPAPYVLGFDYSGVVVELGSAGLHGLSVGDKVLGSIGRGGCYAEYIVVKGHPDKIIRRGNVPAAEASTFGIAYLTAYENVILAGDIQRHRGKWIYIAGAGGGLGHFAVQMAKIHGLNVIGSAGKPTTVDLLRRLGVDHVIDYSQQNVVDEILKLTGGKGADVVYDSTNSASSFEQSSSIVASGGEYIRLGTSAQLKQFGKPDLSSVVEARGAKMIIADLARYTADPEFQNPVARSKVMQGLQQAVQWTEQGLLKAEITKVIPFDPAALQQAFEAFLRGEINVGKVVVQCSE
jgi:NADPH:quinone reductase-like Zn-dependent oxidoreductase